MPVTVRTTRLQNRLKELQRELPRAVSGALATVAQTAIDIVQTNASSDWANNNQIGFDVGLWNRTIDQVEVLPAGGFGILNVQRMGTEQDYEEIFRVPGAWHMGSRRGEAFGRFVIERPGRVEATASLRQAIWGDKQPQWFFLNDGNLQGGAFDPRPGTHTIERSAFEVADDVRRIVSDKVNDRLRSLGVLV